MCRLMVSSTRIRLGPSTIMVMEAEKILVMFLRSPVPIRLQFRVDLAAVVAEGIRSSYLVPDPAMEREVPAGGVIASEVC